MWTEQPDEQEVVQARIRHREGNEYLAAFGVMETTFVGRRSLPGL